MATISMGLFSSYCTARPTRIRAPRTPPSTKPKPRNPDPNHNQLKLNCTAAKELNSLGGDGQFKVFEASFDSELEDEDEEFEEIEVVGPGAKASCRCWNCGAPNAGKSTLLSVVSAAQPTIANYPFTTLLPNLGVVSFDYDSTMVVADLPGLLEGAHWGFGLGHEFLRHTERCSVLIHVVDASGQQPEFEFDAVRLELELFSPEIAGKPYIVAF